MPIILIEEEDSVKYNLLKESLQDEISLKPLRDQRYQNHKNSFFRSSRFSPKSHDEELSDWNSNSVHNSKEKSVIRQFVLPKMKNNRKSKRIEDLSRQLLKYQQFNFDQDDNQGKFRLITLKQMTKMNFIKQNPIKIESPKKIQIKLEFPEKYQRYRQENSQKQILFNQENDISHESQFLSKRSNQGLIPSMKKLSPFNKRTMFRSQSQRDPYQNKKAILIKEHFQCAKDNFPDQLKQKMNARQSGASQSACKPVRHQRRLPVNFLSYSYRKQSIDKVNEKDSPKKYTKSPQFFIDMPTISNNDSKLGVLGLDISEHKRLNEYMFLSINKKIYANK